MFLPPPRCRPREEWRSASLDLPPRLEGHSLTVDGGVPEQLVLEPPVAAEPAAVADTASRRRTQTSPWPWPHQPRTPCPPCSAVHGGSSSPRSRQRRRSEIGPWPTLGPLSPRPSLVHLLAARRRGKGSTPCLTHRSLRPCRHDSAQGLGQRGGLLLPELSRPGRRRASQPAAAWLPNAPVKSLSREFASCSSRPRRSRAPRSPGCSRLKVQLLRWCRFGAPQRGRRRDPRPASGRPPWARPWRRRAVRRTLDGLRRLLPVARPRALTLTCLPLARLLV